MDPDEPETAVTSPERKHKRRHRKKGAKEEVYVPDFNIPGVTKIAISPVVQQDVGCVVGEHVTAEKPWKLIEKEVFQDNLELHEESSEFLPLKDDIINYPKNNLLLGYIPDEIREYDEFYICLTERANDAVTKIIGKINAHQEARLNNTINKKIKKWKTRGSGPEVDENIISNNRPLLEVEVESQYPIFPSKPYFKLRPVEATRDGYAEILPGRFTYSNVYKKRIDGSVQVAPQVRTNEAQTICTYPKNVATQYEYEYTEDPTETEKLLKTAGQFISDQIDEISDILKVNGAIDFYKNDYEQLVTDVKYTIVPEMTQISEYMSFADIKLCKNKMISSISWHPMWTGIVAISYADATPFSYIKNKPNQDDVIRAVHGINPVLLWSFTDGLHAKLFLETHREVTTLSFCPYDENILIGGSSSGQVIIWDIRNKLKYVEEQEIITAAQQKYRILMHSLMKWMKNTKDVSLVRPTAVSDIQYSHRGPISKIQWLNAHWEVSKTGQFQQIPEDRTDTSLQFMTSSEDGAVLFWDLLAKPTIQPGQHKPQRKLKRLKQRPSALMVDVSPYKILHRLLKPHFRINISPPHEVRSLPISTINIPFQSVHYVEVNPNPSRYADISERLIYKPHITRPTETLKCEFSAGTTEGDLMLIEWDGFEYNTGEVVHTQRAKILGMGKYHDGPITCLSRCKFNKDILLTVGGKIFALWKENYPKPIFWRSSQGYRYTHGAWSSHRPTKFRLSRSDGCIELWRLIVQSDTCIQEQCVSAQELTCTYTHPKTLHKVVIGIADYNGSFRLFYSHIAEAYHGLLSEGEFIKSLFTREIERKKEFMAWQENWTTKNKSAIVSLQQVEEEHKQIEEDETEKEKEEPAEENEKKEKEQPKKVVENAGPPPGQYLEWAIEQWNKREQERMNKILLTKKHLDMELLEKQQMPLKKLAAEEAQKKQKQEEQLKNAKKIFDDTVAVLFPAVVKQKPPPPVDPYNSTFAEEEKKPYFEEYCKISENISEFIETHPYKSSFGWNNVLSAGRDRRKIIDGIVNKYIHKRRHKLFKQKRAVAEEQAARAAVFVPKPEKEVSLGSIDFEVFGDDVSIAGELSVGAYSGISFME